MLRQVLEALAPRNASPSYLPLPPSHTISSQDQVVLRFKDCIDDFKQIMPLVEELANPALKMRHWVEIFQVGSVGRVWMCLLLRCEDCVARHLIYARTWQIVKECRSTIQ